MFVVPLHCPPSWCDVGPLRKICKVEGDPLISQGGWGLGGWWSYFRDIIPPPPLPVLNEELPPPPPPPYSILKEPPTYISDVNGDLLYYIYITYNYVQLPGTCVLSIMMCII